MRWYDKLLARVGFGLVHASLNAFLVMLSGKQFYLAWLKWGRSPGPGESAILMVGVGVLMGVATLLLWLVPMHRRPSRAVVITAISIVAGAAGSFLITGPAV